MFGALRAVVGEDREAAGQEKGPSQEPGLSAGLKAPFSLPGLTLLSLYLGFFK